MGDSQEQALVQMVEHLKHLSSLHICLKTLLHFEQIGCEACPEHLKERTFEDIRFGVQDLTRTYLTPTYSKQTSFFFGLYSGVVMGAAVTLSRCHH